jgi:hypothetical protein
MDTAMPGLKMTAAEKLLQDQIDAAEKRGEFSVSAFCFAVC